MQSFRQPDPPPIFWYEYRYWDLPHCEPWRCSRMFLTLQECEDAARAKLAQVNDLEEVVQIRIVQEQTTYIAFLEN